MEPVLRTVAGRYCFCFYPFCGFNNSINQYRETTLALHHFITSNSPQKNSSLTSEFAIHWDCSRVIYLLASIWYIWFLNTLHPCIIRHHKKNSTLESMTLPFYRMCLSPKPQSIKSKDFLNYYFNLMLGK